MYQVFIPMHVRNDHWHLLILKFIKKEIQILNSITSPVFRDEIKENLLVCNMYMLNINTQYVI